MNDLMELTRDEMRNIKAGNMALDGCYFDCCTGGPGSCDDIEGASWPGGGGSCTSNEQCQSEGAPYYECPGGAYLAALCYN